MRGRACQPKRKGLLLHLRPVSGPHPPRTLHIKCKGHESKHEMQGYADSAGSVARVRIWKRKVLDIMLKRTHLTGRNIKARELSLPLQIDYFPSQTFFDTTKPKPLVSITIAKPRKPQRHSNSSQQPIPHHLFPNLLRRPISPLHCRRWTNAPLQQCSLASSTATIINSRTQRVEVSLIRHPHIRTRTLSHHSPGPRPATANSGSTTAPNPPADAVPHTSKTARCSTSTTDRRVPTCTATLAAAQSLPLQSNWRDLDGRDATGTHRLCPLALALKVEGSGAAACTLDGDGGDDVRVVDANVDYTRGFVVVVGHGFFFLSFLCP